MKNHNYTVCSVFAAACIILTTYVVCLGAMSLLRPGFKSRSKYDDYDNESLNFREEPIASWTSMPPLTDEDNNPELEYSDSEESGLAKHLFQYDPSLPTNYKPMYDSNSRNQEWRRSMSKYIIKRLKNKTEGFFVECGASDGEYLSNTLLLEQSYNWTGLLIEADQGVIPRLVERNRRAWVADVCLSPEPKPMNATMKGSNDVNVLTFLPNFASESVREERKWFSRNFQVECYPLHMLLEALGRNYVDYLSLDVEGVELDVLRTIPWHKIRIKLITVEFRPETRDLIGVYLEAVGYRQVYTMDNPSEFVHDDVYELIEKKEND